MAKHQLLYLIGTNIHSTMFARINDHVDQGKAGQPLQKKLAPAPKRVEETVTKVKEFVNFIVNDSILTASSRSVTNSKAVKETIPVVLSTRGPYELISSFITQGK